MCWVIFFYWIISLNWLLLIFIHLDDQICDECQGARCNGKYAPYFCANITCLQYYCENCWATIHSRPGREFHKPLVKEGADRPRAIPFRWCWLKWNEMKLIFFFFDVWIFFDDMFLPWFTYPIHTHTYEDDTFIIYYFDWFFFLAVRVCFLHVLTIFFFFLAIDWLISFFVT